MRLVTYTDLAALEQLHAMVGGFFPCTQERCVRCQIGKAETYFALPVYDLTRGHLTLLIPTQGLPTEMYRAIGRAVAQCGISGLLVGTWNAECEGMRGLAKRLEPEELIELGRLAAQWARKRPRIGKRVRLGKVLAEMQTNAP